MEHPAVIVSEHLCAVQPPRGRSLRTIQPTVYNPQQAFAVRILIIEGCQIHISAYDRQKTASRHCTEQLLH